MQKHPQLQICKVDEIDESLLTFELEKEQRDKAKGAEIKFRKSTQRYPGYRQLIARAQYYDSGKKRAIAVATKLVGVIFDDEPEWVYETDKSKSPIAERRIEARTLKAEGQRAVASQVGSFVKKKVEYAADAIIVKKVPIEILLTVAALSGMRGLTDATSVANYWNTNLSTLREMFPEYDLEEISHDTVRRICCRLRKNECVTSRAASTTGSPSGTARTGATSPSTAKAVGPRGVTRTIGR